MVSDKFMVNSDAGRMAAARYATENFAWHAGLDRRATLRLSLLVEETLGMVKAMVDDFYGRVWFVGDADACEIHLEATADMDSDRKQELLSVSSTGRNAAARGFMGMLGDVFMGALHGLSRTLDAYGRETARFGVVHTEGMGGAAVDEMSLIWTLSAYRDGLDTYRDKDQEAEQAWDELEKSIVASLADEVTVGVRGDCIEMVIVKDFM